MKISETKKPSINTKDGETAVNPQLYLKIVSMKNMNVKFTSKKQNKKERNK